MGEHSYNYRENTRDSRDRNYHRQRERDRDRDQHRHDERFGTNSRDNISNNHNSASYHNRDQASRTHHSPHRYQRRDDSRSPPPLERWERRLQDAKKAHRPRLKNWSRGRFGIKGSSASERFEALRWDSAGRERDRGVNNGDMSVVRERREELSSRDFWEHYERRRLPVIVSGIPWHEGWRASERWTFERLDRK